MNIKKIKDIISEIIYEIISTKNPFEIGDLVKLRPDILNRIHQGPNHNSRNWRKTIENLKDKMGKITKVFPNSKNVNVQFKNSWTNKDEYGREYTTNTIGINHEELVPYSEDPSLSEQFGGYVSDKDMKKDPKHISGERWRIKFQSSKDLKKHGNTEKSPINENVDDDWCLHCGGKLKYVANISSPGSGRAWDCTQCKHHYIKMGGTLIDTSDIRPDEDLPWELDPSDVMEFRDLGKDWTKNISVNEIREVIQEIIKEICPRIFEDSNRPNKNYIILGKRGPVTLYYTASPTQGDQMSQFGYSVAHKFKSLEDVYHKIAELRGKYKGITNWDYEIVGIPSQPESPFVRPIRHFGHSVSKPVKKGDEWFVRWSIRGKTDDNKSYYTDDKKDAFDTYAVMLRNANEENKKLGQK